MIESIDIVEYLSQFTELEEKNGEYWGLSPLKEEKTPSFSVRRETNSFYDFSSGLGGSVFSFTKYYYHCSGSEAIKILKKYAGVDGELGSSTGRMAAVDTFRKFGAKKSQKSHKKEKTGVIFAPDYMDRFVVNEQKLSIWEQEGISKESMSKFCVRYDKFSNRIVYPIKNLNGEIVNIGGRTLCPDYKELGLRKYTYFAGWGTMDVIYGLYENLQDVMERKEIVLFEGCKSVLIADTWGIHNTGALLTSHLNPNQMKILAKLGVRVVFALDKEVYITQDRNIRKLKNYTNVEYLFDVNGLLDAKDAPVDKGREVFMNLYNDRKHFR